MVNYFSRYPLRLAIVVAVGVFLGGLGFYLFQIDRAFGSVAVEDFDPDSARAAIITLPDDQRGAGPNGFEEEDDEDGFDFDVLDLSYDNLPPAELFPTTFGTPLPDSLFDAYLLLGLDASEFRSDVIILLLEPKAGGTPIMVSLPRDLYAWNPCRNRFTRLNEGLIGCSDVASGPELMAIMVQDYTGIKVDHLARINFSGFARLVDVMGGVEVCVDDPTRDLKSGLDLPNPGCQNLAGDQALAWVRSRNGEKLVDGQWTRLPGSDFTRQRAQQDVLFQLAGKAASFASPMELTERLNAVSSSVRLNSAWTFSQAVGKAWRHRGITPASVARFSIDGQNYRTPEGAIVVLPRVTFTEQLGGVYNLPTG